MCSIFSSRQTFITRDKNGIYLKKWIFTFPKKSRDIFSDFSGDQAIPYEIFVDKVVNFYDFNRAKLARMEEDGEESDEIRHWGYLIQIYLNKTLYEVFNFLLSAKT